MYGPGDDPEAAEARRAERDALLLDGHDPAAGEEGREPDDRDAAAPPRSNMPFILSVSVPGLGHALYGAPAAGIAAVVLSLVLVLACVYAFVVTVFLFLGDQPVVRPLVVLGGLLVYSLVFTGLVAWDSRELEDRDGRVTPAMHAAIISAVAVLALSLWLLS